MCTYNDLKYFSNFFATLLYDFCYQESAWKCHVWKRGEKNGKSNKIQRKFHFKQIARLYIFSFSFFTFYKRSVLCNQCYRHVNTFFFYFRAVKFTSKLFGQALSKRIKATILFATETGKSEMYAKKLGEIFSHAFHSQVLR